MEERAKKVLDTLQGQCSKREYCRKDIYSKALKALDGDVNVAAEVVEALVNDRFVDDLRYAGAFAREKSRFNGWGPVKIRFALRAKGIESALIEEALDSVDPQAAVDILSKLLAAKAASLEGDPQKKFKLIKFALSRGYEYDQIRDYISLY